MKRIKRALAALLSVVLAATLLTVPALAERDFSVEEGLAEELRELGLFKGVSETDFDLGRAPTRGEALVLLVRFMGEEKNALAGAWEHPFKDVRDWEDKYVGYAYSAGLTKGVSDDEFAGSDTISCATYLTFMLRALGYSDARGDFNWNEPFSLAEKAGLLESSRFANSGIDQTEFLRADVVLISYSALTAYQKGSADTLADRLIAQGAIDADTYKGVIDPYALTQRSKLSAATVEEARKNVLAQGAFALKRELVSDEGYGTIIEGALEGVPHGAAPQMYFIAGEKSEVDTGRVASLPLPAGSQQNKKAPDKVTFSGSGQVTVEYQVNYPEDLYLTDMETGENYLAISAGKCVYTLDMKTGEGTLKVYFADGTLRYEFVFNAVTGNRTQLD